jgi:glycosyltransferase involved in cell wall biosynthesis
MKINSKVDNGVISVIVPIYKVEKYIDKCLESIVEQTYRKLQIILVDDGSPDNCPQLCDIWAKKDDRIQVVHKKNGGLASARNAGLDVATGEYISFIDSDDYIEKNMFEIMVNEFKDSDVGAVGCGILEVYSNGKRNELAIQYGNIEPMEAIKSLLLNNGKVHSFAWNKLYRADIIGNLRFVEELRYGEDTPFVYHVLKRCKKYYQVDKVLYHYVRRDDSLIGNCFRHDKMLSLKASELIKEDCYADLPNLKEFADCNIINVIFYLFRSIFLSDNWQKLFMDDFIRLHKILRNANLKIILKYYSKKRYIQLLLCKKMPLFFALILRLKMQIKDIWGENA